MSLDKEVHFESDLCAAMAARVWPYAEKDSESFDRANGLYRRRSRGTRPIAFGAGEVLAQLAAQDALDDGLFQFLEHGLDAGGVHRAGDELLKQFLRQDRFRRSGRWALLAWHGGS